MSLKWQVTGIKETVARLAAFQRKFRTKSLRRAGNEAASIILPVLKANTPTAKKEYGKGGSLRKSMGRKVSVKKDRLWFGVGPRTKWQKEIAKANRYWRDKQGRVRKAPIRWSRNEQPSRRAHLTERKTSFLSRTQRQTMARANERMQQVLAEAVAEV